MLIIHSWRRDFAPWSLLSSRRNVQNASGQVNAAGADAQHYGWRIWPGAFWQQQRTRQSWAQAGKREFFWSPQDSSGLSGIVSDLIAGERTDAASTKWTRVHVSPQHPPAGTCEFSSQVQYKPTLFSTLFKSFLERNFSALCCLFVHFIISRFLNPHRHKGVCLQIPAKYEPP